MCHSMHQAFRYLLINQRKFLGNSREKKKIWGKISCSGKKILNFKMQVHIMPWEKNLLVIIKQLQSKPYQGQFCQLNTSCPQSRWHWCHDKLLQSNNLSGIGCGPNYFSFGERFTQGVPEVDNPTCKYSFTFIFKSEVEFASCVLKVAIFWMCNRPQIKGTYTH